MHKPFDLEAAKAGEPVEYYGFSGWESCRFLGVSAGPEYLVVERTKDRVFQLAYAMPEHLRMAPKKVTVRYRVAAFIDPDGAAWTDTTNTPEKELLMAAHLDFKEWLSDWQEVEIPQ